MEGLRPLLSGLRGGGEIVAAGPSENIVRQKRSYMYRGVPETDTGEAEFGWKEEAGRGGGVNSS